MTNTRNTIGCYRLTTKSGLVHIIDTRTNKVLFVGTDMAHCRTLATKWMRRDADAAAAKWTAANKTEERA